MPIEAKIGQFIDAPLELPAMREVAQRLGLPTVFINSMTAAEAILEENVDAGLLDVATALARSLSSEE